MKRFLSLVVLTALLFTTSACSANKPPELATVRSKRILAVLRDMNNAYEKKDLTAFMADISPNYRERDALSGSLASVFSRYETIRFNIQYSKMFIVLEEKGQVKASFNWDAEWLATGGTTQKNGARVTMVFEAGTFKLLSIDGKNPFVPVQGEIPGGKQ
jgi:hypothetical protein